MKNSSIVIIIVLALVAGSTAVAGCDEEPESTTTGSESGDCSVDWAIKQLHYGVGAHEWSRLNTNWLISHLPATVSRNPHLSRTEMQTVSTSFWHIAANPRAGWSLRHQFCFSGNLTFEVTPTPADPRRYNLEWGGERLSTIIGGSLSRYFEVSLPAPGGSLVVMNDPEGSQVHEAILSLSASGAPFDVTYKRVTSIPPVRKQMRGTFMGQNMSVPGETTTILWLTFEPKVSRTPTRPMYLRFMGSELAHEFEWDFGRYLSEITDVGPVYVVGSSGETLTFPTVATFAATQFLVDESEPTSWAVIWPTENGISLTVMLHTYEQSGTDYTYMTTVVIPMGSCPN